MNTSDLKIELIKAIIDSNDIDLLLKINTLLIEKNYPETDVRSHLVNEPALEYQKMANKDIRVFSEAEQEKINIALQQYENGDCISNEEAQIELEKWFQEQEK